MIRLSYKVTIIMLKINNFIQKFAGYSIETYLHGYNYKDCDWEDSIEDEYFFEMENRFYKMTLQENKKEEKEEKTEEKEEKMEEKEEK